MPIAPRMGKLTQNHAKLQKNIGRARLGYVFFEKKLLLYEVTRENH